jgi:hypothetical protein
MSSVPRSPNASRGTTHEIQVATPYRLDLTVSALRRTATNLVDVYTSDGRYLRALGGFAEPVIVSVTQPRADALAVSVSGSAGDTEGALVSVRRMLGTERDLSGFHRHAVIPELWSSHSVLASIRSIALERKADNGTECHPNELSRLQSCRWHLIAGTHAGSSDLDKCRARRRSLAKMRREIQASRERSSACQNTNRFKHPFTRTVSLIRRSCI